MRRIRTLVIDDEPMARQRILKLLSLYNDFNVIGVCDNGQTALDSITLNTPDLVFLDIEMPKFTGVELLKRLPSESRPIVVFVTAYSKYAVQAFEFFALDYLLKPFTENRFSTTIDRIIEAFQKKETKNVQRQLEAYLKFLDEPVTKRADARRKLTVTIGNRIHLIDINHIRYISASSNYVTVYTLQNKYVLRRTLKSFETHLDFKNFVRIHKSYLINPEQIKEIQKNGGGSYLVYMSDKEFLSVSRKFKEEFKKRIL